MRLRSGAPINRQAHLLSLRFSLGGTRPDVPEQRRQIGDLARSSVATTSAIASRSVERRIGARHAIEFRARRASSRTGRCGSRDNRRARPKRPPSSSSTSSRAGSHCGNTRRKRLRGRDLHLAQQRLHILGEDALRRILLGLHLAVDERDGEHIGKAVIGLLLGCARCACRPPRRRR